MKFTKQQLDTLWNIAGTSQELIQAFVGGNKYVEVTVLAGFTTNIAPLYMVIVTNLSEPTTIDDPDAMKGATFEYAQPFNTYPEALTAFSAIAAAVKP